MISDFLLARERMNSVAEAQSEKADVVQGIWYKSDKERKGVGVMTFDQTINRRNTSSLKWDTMKEHGVPEEALPFWVADMDFPAPPGVQDAFLVRINHGIFGYTRPDSGYYEAICNWMKKRHDWSIQPDWITITPGVVPAVNFIIQCFTSPGDGVLVQQPSYPPFMSGIQKNGRTLITSHLVQKENRYEIDPVEFEEKLVAGNVRLFLLCSPHNPTGRVFTEEELRTMADLCLKHGVLMVSDEIHHDLVLRGKHRPTASLSTAYSMNCFTCTAPSKTFNLAGLQISNIITENSELRETLNLYMEKMGLSVSNTFSLIGTEAAYRTGEAWLEDLLDHIRENRNVAVDFFKERYPSIPVTESEATYLLWIDFRSLGMGPEELREFMLTKANVWFNDGFLFGPAGAGFERMNLACSKDVLKQGLKRLDKALSSIFR